jgi:hypothetical protein
MYCSEVRFFVQEIIDTYDLNGPWTTIAKRVVVIRNRIFRKHNVINWGLISRNPFQKLKMIVDLGNEWKKI